VKVLLGATGEDFVLSLDEDDGNSEWQSRDWSGDVPFALCKQLNNIEAKARYVKQMSFGPSGEWYVYGEKRDGSGGHSWWGGTSTTCSDIIKGQTGNNLQVSFGCDSSWVYVKGRNGHLVTSPDNLAERMAKIHKQSGLIKRVRLLPPSYDDYDYCGGSSTPNYFISDSEGTQWSGSLGEHFGNNLKEGGRDEVMDVAQAEDKSWIVIRPNRFTASTGVSNRLTSRLSQFYQDQKTRRQETNHRIKMYDAQIVRAAAEAAAAARAAEEERARAAEAAVAAARAERERLAEEKRQAEIERRLQEEKKRKREELEKSVLALRRTNQVQETIKSKKLRVGTVVHAVGDISTVGAVSPGVITRLRPDGVDVRTHLGGGSTFFFRDPRQLVVTNGQSDQSVEWSDTMLVIFLAVDKYEASISFLKCECHNGVCRCKVVASAKVSVDPSPKSIRPVLENQLDSRMVRRFDEYVCAEKIDLFRLSQVVSTLRKDHKDRERCIEELTRHIGVNINHPMYINEKKVHGGGPELQEWLKALQRCQVIEAVAEALEKFLKGTSGDSSGCVIHEVQYEHRDSASRGRLFAIGSKVKITGEKYARTTTLQGMPSELRCPLVGSFAYDVDCENSEVRLMCSLAAQLGFESLVPTLINYRDNRHHWLDKICLVHDVTMEKAKRLPNIIMSGGRYDTWLKFVCQPKTKRRDIDNFACKLWLEIRALRDQLLVHPRFSWTIIERRTLLAEGRHLNVIDSLLMPRIVANCENEVLGIMHRCFFDHGWHVRAKVFDGLIIEPGEITSLISKVLLSAEAACLAQGWSIRLIEKPLKNTHRKAMPSLNTSQRAVQALMQKPAHSVCPGNYY